MKEETARPGSIKEQLVIPGMEGISSSVDSEGSRRSLGKNTYDPSWEMQDRSPLDRTQKMH